MPRNAMRFHLPLGLVLASSLLACRQACPAGTTLQGKPAPLGTAQWCERGESRADPLPVAEPEYEAVLDFKVEKPVAPVGRSIDGPVTRWYASGLLASRGAFAINANGASVAHGLWTFWDEDGKRKSQGNYRMGAPVGCFSFWDGEGARRNAAYAPRLNGFYESPCTNADGSAVEELEMRFNGREKAQTLGDISLQTYLSPGGLGFKNTNYLVTEPGIGPNLELAARRHLGHLRLGGVVAARASDDRDHEAGLLAGMAAVILPSPHHRLALELSASLGVQYMRSKDRESRGFSALKATHFVEPYVALELGAAFSVHPSLDVVIAGRIAGGIPRERTTTDTFCHANGCLEEHTETWEVGRYSPGLALGLRMPLR